MSSAAGGAADVEPMNLGDRAAVAVAAYREGRTDLMADLVRSATPLLWNIVRSQGVERDDAEDVVQGVWLALVRNADALRDPQAVLKWLVVTARRAAWQATQRRRDETRRTTELPEEELVPARALRSTEPAPDEPVLEDERDRTLWRHFTELDPRCQEVLRSVAMADRPDYRAIAEATGLRVTSVGVIRGRCLGRLRALLDDDPRWADR